MFILPLDASCPPRTIALLACAWAALIAIPARSQSSGGAVPPGTPGPAETVVVVTASPPENEDRESPGESADENEGREAAEREEQAPPPGGMLTRVEAGSPPRAGEFSAESAPDGRPEFPPEWSGELRFHGRLSGTYSDRRWEGARRRLGRPGLGGITNPAGADRLGGRIFLEGPLTPGRLWFSLEATPGVSRDYFRDDVSTAELLRDEVPPGGAGREFALGGSRAGLHYKFRIDWRMGERHRLALFAGGASESAAGLLRLAGRQVDPAGDALIPIGPAPGGLAPAGADDGPYGTRRTGASEFGLRYSGEFSEAFAIELLVVDASDRLTERPAPGADSIRYLDIRREQVFDEQLLNGRSPATSPAQYAFGGLGFFTDNSAGRARRWGVNFIHRFSAAGSHELKYGVEYLDRRVRENLLSSGPRDASGPGVYLASTRGVPIPDSFIRVRGGAMAEVSCNGVDPTAQVFEDACPLLSYSLLRGNLNPETPFVREYERAAFLRDRWRAGAFTLDLGVRYRDLSMDNPDAYELRSALTGATLIGEDGQPVCTRDRPDVPGGGASDLSDFYATPANCIVGPGQFIGGGHHFRGEIEPRIGITWDAGGPGALRLSADAGRFHDALTREQLLHAFTTEFGVARATFLNPDLTRQFGGAITVGGDYRYVAPKTRLGYQDHLRFGLEWQPAPDWGIRIAAGGSRQGRVLIATQATPMEEIANFFYDNAVAFWGRCANCAPGQTSLFPGYPSGNGNQSRYFSSVTLANPGINTPPGLFGNPARRERYLEAVVEKRAGEGRRLGFSARGRLARARGNYEGKIEQDNGIGEVKSASMFDFPLSGLTRGQYAIGPLDPALPSYFRATLRCDDFGVRNFSAGLTWRWSEGTLRTPHLADPFTPYPGLIPGEAPQYYLLKLDDTGNPTRAILRDYRLVPRGALGRNPAVSAWDLRIEYRRALSLGQLTFSLAIENLRNETRVIRYDDAVETPLGYTEPVALPVWGRAPPRFPPLADSTRARNPAFGMPLVTQNPRTIRIGASWSF
jgi:hypothetical protein